MTGSNVQQMTSASPYDAIYDPVRPELQSVIVNIASLASEHGSHEGAMAERLAHVLSAPGKRLRPAITLLASRLWRNPSELDVMMGTAVELLHIATLIHDDTVDAADTRRGRETASNLWGRNVAVLLGDYVFAAAARFVCDTNSVRLVRRFSETIMELARGELNELLDGQDSHVTRGHRYVDGRAPWKQAKEDREAAATTLWTALNIIETLRTVAYPYLPFSTQTLHELLGHAGDVRF